METTCSSLLSELQKIWDEVGEPDLERDRMLFELEKECLEVYRRKVDQANQCRAQLRQAVASSEAELALICSALGERPTHTRQSSRSLKMELQTIIPQLQEMQRRKKERSLQFTDVLEQIHNITRDLCSSLDENAFVAVFDETDLSLKRLEELKIQLLALQKEKSDRLKQVLEHLSTINSLCLVLGMDFKHTVNEIHPTLDDSSGAKNISSDTIKRLSSLIHRLKELKRQRMQKLQDLAATMVELWTLMDTPVEEQQNFQNVTKNIAASEDEITETNTLSVDFINYAEIEVLRLQKMKSSKIKEVLLKKKSHLDEICRAAHMVVDGQNSIDYSAETIESGAIDLSYLLEQIEIQISKAKEEAFNRKEILDKIETWLAACEEESWLEEYNRDDNRYNAGRGAHLILKRAEKARALVNKLPAMVESLTSKAKAWECERGEEFKYDGVSLQSMLDKYRILQQDKEQERRRQRDQKKIQGQLIAEQEALFGSKPSPKSGRKNLGTSAGAMASKRYSMGGMMLQTPHTDKIMRYPHTHRENNTSKLQPSRTHHLSGVTGQASGKRGISAIPAKKLASNSIYQNENESKLIRKPLSPISSSLSSEANSANLLHNRKDRELGDTVSTNKIPWATPNNKISAFDQNETPKTKPIPVPKTPSTVSVAMQMAMTPTTPCIPRGDRVEYSFEEKRAGFFLDNSHAGSSIDN